MIDLDWTSEEATKPFIATLPHERLFFNETDGSSFPNGGLRATHTAAAYLSWDKTSSPFVRGDTLYIPSAFITWNGDALDEKTPLLRSQEAVNKAALRVLHHLGDTDANGVDSNNGWEQEFYIVDREHYLQRPDLIACGRTLIGSNPPRGQQTDCNYFSRVPLRIKHCFEEVQKILHKSGVNMMVYHSEVGPSQYELSPIFSLTNSSADTNVLAMDVLQEVAYENGLVVLYHEKPFANVNGSGKHCNWSLSVKNSGRNLFEPGKTIADQRSFITFTSCLLRAVNRHGNLIRIGASSAGNDHRLGAQEAPPGIISLYLGEGLGNRIESIISGKSDLEGYGAVDKVIHFGSSSVQPIKGSAEDRNRTAPFPFCGNRFELRAVGSGQHIGLALTFVHAAITESLDYVADELDKGIPLKEVVRDVLKNNIKAMFNGNSYSKEWQDEEAPKRGIISYPSSVEAIHTLTDPKNIDLHAKTGIFKPQEVHARQTIMYENYIETILIEANCLVNMLNTGVIPVCLKDLKTYENTILYEERKEILTSLMQMTRKLMSQIESFPAESE